MTPQYLYPKNIRIGGARGPLDKPHEVCIYIGPIKKLKGQLAIIIRKTAETVIAQFNAIGLIHKKKALGLGWHTFSGYDFKLTKLEVDIEFPKGLYTPPRQGMAAFRRTVGDLGRAAGLSIEEATAILETFIRKYPSVRNPQPQNIVKDPMPETLRVLERFKNHEFIDDEHDNQLPII